MSFKFERLEIWQLAVEYVDEVYVLSAELPEDERYNLRSQLRRAATSVALNIAEGSTGQTNSEQARFLGTALRSLLETIACLHLLRRRSYVAEKEMHSLYRAADRLAAKIQAMRKVILSQKART